MKQKSMMILVVTAAVVFLVMPFMAKKRGGPAAELPKNNRPVFVEFYSTSCNICKMMKPGLRELEREFEGRVDFVFLNVEESASRKLSERFSVYALPTIAVLDAGGRTIGRFEGAVGMPTLRGTLDEALSGGGETL